MEQIPLVILKFDIIWTREIYSVYVNESKITVIVLLIPWRVYIFSTIRQFYYAVKFPSGNITFPTDDFACNVLFENVFLSVAANAPE